MIYLDIQVTRKDILSARLHRWIARRFQRLLPAEFYKSHSDCPLALAISRAANGDAVDIGCCCFFIGASGPWETPERLVRWMEEFDFRRRSAVPFSYRLALVRADRPGEEGE